MTYIGVALRRLVEERANHLCEYCLLPAGVAFFPHEVDHVIAEKHSGATDADNLAFACWRCNRYKGTDLGSFDPQTGVFSFLFNPRTQNWVEHFRCEEIRLVGLTPEGRTTVSLLQKKMTMPTFVWKWLNRGINGLNRSVSSERNCWSS